MNSYRHRKEAVFNLSASSGPVVQKSTSSVGQFRGDVKLKLRNCTRKSRLPSRELSNDARRLDFDSFNIDHNCEEVCKQGDKKCLLEVILTDDTTESESEGMEGRGDEMSRNNVIPSSREKRLLTASNIVICKSDSNCVSLEDSSDTTSAGNLNVTTSNQPTSSKTCLFQNKLILGVGEFVLHACMHLRWQSK